MSKKYRGTANPEYIAAMRDIRKSSAASPHADSRTKRAKSRQAAKTRAVKDSGEA